MLDAAQCRQARLARDARFDGRFVVGVTSTGIYCRPICPAIPSKDTRVRYFDTPLAAAEAGFRPCLRCRPDSAPDSPAWRGTRTTLERALRLIDDGALGDGSLGDLCQRLGVGERHLRRLFHDGLGVSPKAYAQHRQCLFAKQLLHQTTLPITDIAYASGFRSLRRFNDAFVTRIGLAPRELRRSAADSANGGQNGEPLTLWLAYRPPYAWPALRDFHAGRAIAGLEWVGEAYYGRHIRWGGARGSFTAEHVSQRHAFRVRLLLDDLRALSPVVRRIRRVLDLDADTTTIETHLAGAFPGLALVEGLRLPGIWSPFEAGVRAILGQQVSTDAARGLVTRLVEARGEPTEHGHHFPVPEAIADSELDELRMPGARKATLRRFASWYAEGEADDDPLTWTALKGIGPWTANYAALRGIGAPDIWLDGDAGVRRALPRLEGEDPARGAPWRSYLTLQLWSSTP
ncbi:MULTISPECIES: AlkA N-terminal domain-containing protein [Halomonas]|uniref:DNA-3-methyladenine glycosylase II n=1 Tax=Halomonas halophila TaxID=29573 RepID=A0ABQ0U0B0_9GAMM|nr:MULTISPECIES: AlkA N-terminal domain-containing protein [Halomonas]MDR5888659.1 AlkA N-terminal domain-containing protein [Halomonas salina]WJY07840.1 AlkA N-terminal domain-containing protein [Halomonas halophila]GEK71979.1 3-methyladenine DNA glycosylase [Halomonas halophila]